MVSRLVDLGQPNGLVFKVGRFIAAKEWAKEIAKLKETLNHARARWQVRAVRVLSCF